MKSSDIRFYAEVAGAFALGLLTFVATLVLPFLALAVGVAVIVWTLRFLGVLS